MGQSPTRTTLPIPQDVRCRRVVGGILSILDRVVSSLNEQPGQKVTRPGLFHGDQGRAVADTQQESGAPAHRWQCPAADAALPHNDTLSVSQIMQQQHNGKPHRTASRIPADRRVDKTLRFADDPDIQIGGTPAEQQTVRHGLPTHDNCGQTARANSRQHLTLERQP